MKRDLTELKKITFDLMNNDSSSEFNKEIFNEVNENEITLLSKEETETEIVKENFTLANQEKNLIKKSLEKHKGKRKLAAEELGISERTLYRKIKQFDINDLE